jgi:hypothetical protein
VEKFIARIEFEFETDALTDGGRRLRELSAVAESAGFTMIRGEVHPAAEGQESPERPAGPATARRSTLRQPRSAQGSFRNTGPAQQSYAWRSYDSCDGQVGNRDWSGIVGPRRCARAP